MHKQLFGLVGLVGLTVAVVVVGCGDEPEPTFHPYVYEGAVPWDGGCPDPNINCPGQAAFECGMKALQLNHARCSNRDECIAAKGPDPADCYTMCGHAPVHRGQERAYLDEAKEEVFKYCNRARCTAYLECPRPNNAEIDCVDAGTHGLCGWVEGVFRFPDAGDTGTPPPPRDASTPTPPDAGTPRPDAATPVPPDAATPVPADAATPVPPDAATPVPPDAATPVPPDAAAPGLDAAPEPPDADAPGLDAAPEPPDAAPEPPDADVEPPDADPPDAP